MKRVICFIIVVVFIFSCAGCDNTDSKNSPSKTIEEFELAFNERDVDKVISFFTPEFQAKLKAEMAIGSIFGEMLGFGDIFSNEMLDGIFGVSFASNYINLEIISEKYDNDKTKVSLLVLFTCGEESSIDIIEMTNISGNWYFNVED